MPEKLDPQLDELRRRARRRLIGAVVLALAAAVLVPMLLESDPKPLGEDVSVKIPPVDEGKFVSKLGDKSKGANAPAAKSAPSETAVVATPAKDVAKDAAREPAKEPARDATAAATKDANAAAAKDATASAAKDTAPQPSAASAPTDVPPTTPAADAPPPLKDATAARADAASTASPTKAAETLPADRGTKATDASKVSAKTGSYSVQLAAFSDDKGASALAARLKKAGHPAYTEPYTTSRGTLYRVRVGPYASRDAAEAARAKLKADGQNGIIAAAN